MTEPATTQAGTAEIAVDGDVVELDPPSRLVQTWRLLTEVAAEGFTRVTYEIEPMDADVSKLTVT